MSADEQLYSTHAGLLWFLKFEFASSTAYYTNWNHTVTWDGHDWLGLGAVVSVSPIQVSEQLQYPALDVGLQVANPGLLALAMGTVSEYRRRPITLWLQVLDDTLQRVDEPELYWGGLMDHMKLNTGDGRSGASLTMRCELTGREKGSAQTLRLNHAQQKARFPTDTGLSRIEQLTGQPQPWLTKRFQQI